MDSDLIVFHVRDRRRLWDLRVVSGQLTACFNPFNVDDSRRFSSKTAICQAGLRPDELPQAPFARVSIDIRRVTYRHLRNVVVVTLLGHSLSCSTVKLSVKLRLRAWQRIVSEL